MTSRRTRILAAALLVLCGAVLLTAQAPPRHFLWTVRGEGPSVAYLLGSLHVLTPDFYPLPERIEQAFAASGTLVEEIDLAEMESPETLMAAMSKAVFLDGRTLEQVISPALYARVAGKAAPAGLPMTALARMKPWMVAVSLTAPAMKQAGFDPAMGVDRHFFDRARAAGIPVEGLETLAYQLDRFDTLPMALQAGMLEAAMDDLETQIAQVRVIAGAWARGDVTVIERLLLEGFRDAPELTERFLVERNRNWVPKVDDCLARPRPCFIVVGAAHLVGPDSLVALLRTKGYDVVQQ
ncbi:MAG: TraB/GumN family protein [Vicinamibacterales bacterium]|nr:TraB/GumN family protein [Vicinamibacterales bacterium]